GLFNRGGGMRLAGKVALITGGASGMGQSEATIFAREGARVVVADLLELEARQVVEKIAAAGGQARFVKLDVTSESDWQDAVKAAVTAFGKLDLLVNNAGISGTFDPDITSTAAWDALMGVNAKGVFLGMKYAVPAMREAGGGAIVNISSISGFVGQDRVHMAYNASKGAVRIMTKSAAVQFAQHGIRVNSVHPGIMPPMRTSRASADREWRAKSVRAVPMKREGRVEEVAHAVLFLASDEASYITGTELVVDGGSLEVWGSRGPSMADEASFDRAKAKAFTMLMVRHLEGAAVSIMLEVGRRVGLFEAMAKMGAVTRAEIAERTGLSERYIREWLAAMTCGGIVEYAAAEGTYRLPREHAAGLTGSSRRNLTSMAGMFALTERVIPHGAQ